MAFAAGSGITPILSIIKTALAREAKSQFTLIYANQQANSIMFREELEDLKNIYMNRFLLVHILKREAQDIDLFSGRIDEKKLQQLCANWIDIKTTNIASICGPEPIMLTVFDFLRQQGMDNNPIKFELFASSMRTQKPNTIQLQTV